MFLYSIWSIMITAHIENILKSVKTRENLIRSKFIGRNLLNISRMLSSESKAIDYFCISNTSTPNSKKIPLGYHRPCPSKVFPKLDPENPKSRRKAVNKEKMTQAVFLKKLKRFAKIRKWKPVKSLSLEKSTNLPLSYSFSYLPELGKAFPEIQRLSFELSYIYGLKTFISKINQHFLNLEDLQLDFKVESNEMQELGYGCLRIKNEVTNIPLKKLSLTMDFSTPMFFQRDFQAFGSSLTKHLSHLDHLTLHFKFGDLGLNRRSYNREFTAIMDMLIAPLRYVKELVFKFEDSPEDPIGVLVALVEACANHLENIRSLELIFTNCNLLAGDREKLEYMIQSQHKNMKYFKILCTPSKASKK